MATQHAMHWERVRDILEVGHKAICGLGAHGDTLVAMSFATREPVTEFAIMPDNTIATRPVREWLGLGRH